MLPGSSKICIPCCHPRVAYILQVDICIKISHLASPQDLSELKPTYQLASIRFLKECIQTNHSYLDCHSPHNTLVQGWV